MHRAQVLIEEWQYEALKSMASRQDRSISELLREILSQQLRSTQGTSDLSAIEGLGEDSEANGKEHDQFLYGARKEP